MLCKVTCLLFAQVPGDCTITTNVWSALLQCQGMPLGLLLNVMYYSVCMVLKDKKECPKWLGIGLDGVMQFNYEDKKSCTRVCIMKCHYKYVYTV